jgi:hypothetical protein
MKLYYTLQNQEPLRLFVFRDSVTYEHLQIKDCILAEKEQAMLEELYLLPLMECAMIGASV